MQAERGLSRNQWVLFGVSMVLMPLASFEEFGVFGNFWNPWMRIQLAFVMWFIAFLLLVVMTVDYFRRRKNQ